MYNMYAMIPNRNIVANAPNITATMKIIIPLIISPAYTVPMPGRKNDIIKAIIGFAIFSPPMITYSYILIGERC